MVVAWEAAEALVTCVGGLLADMERVVAPHRLALVGTGAARAGCYPATAWVVSAVRSLRRLWQSVWSIHSLLTLSSPRSRNRPAFCLVFICPNTGSTIALRRA